MKFALFVACAALVEAQSCSQFSNDPSNCTAANNCTFVSLNATCSDNATYCDTSSKTCGANCAAGSLITNVKTCSTCTNTCAGKSETDCAANPGQCRWQTAFTYCSNAPTPPHCTTATSESTCTAQENCFWANISVSICGQASAAANRCLPCNSSNQYTEDMRSGLKNLVGNTCTHAKAGDFVSDFSYTINGYSQNAQCSNITSPPMDPPDRWSLSDFIKIFFRGNFDAASELPTCVAPTTAPTIAPTTSAPSSANRTSAPTAATADTTNDASALLPSAAFLLLAASLLA